MTLYVVSCSKDVHEREDVSMCPYTHLQGLQEVRVRDPLRSTTDQREVAVAQLPEAADTMSRQRCGSGARAEVREQQGAQVRDSPRPNGVDSKPQSMQPHLPSRHDQAHHGVP